MLMGERRRGGSIGRIESVLVWQSRLQQALAHMLSVGGVAIVQSADEA